MSALNKNFILIVLMCVHGLSFSADQEMPLKYKGYEFTPNYSQTVGDDSPAVSVLKDALGDGKKADLVGSSTLGGDTVVAYIVGFTKEGVNEYRQKSMELASKGILMGHPTFDGVSVIRDNEVIDLLKANHRPQKGEDRQLWPQGGMGGHDYYGCIYEKPIFKATLFNPETPNLFVITGTGNYTSDIRGGGTSDSLALHIFSHDDYKEMLDNELMEVNYKPFNPDVVRKDYYFPKSEYPAKNLSFENNEGRKRYSKVFIQDFDENNKLDLLIWTREYKSRKIAKDTKPGFDLANNTFTRYEENYTSTGFDVKGIDTKTAEAWLDQFNLTWKAGWPNENLCANPGRRTLPMTGIGDDPVITE